MKNSQSVNFLLYWRKFWLLLLLQCLAALLRNEFSLSFLCISLSRCFNSKPVFSVPVRTTSNSPSTERKTKKCSKAQIYIFSSFCPLHSASAVASGFTAYEFTTSMNSLLPILLSRCGPSTLVSAQVLLLAAASVAATVLARNL